MAKIIKFVYVLAIFFSLFLVAKNVNGWTCVEDSDCPANICQPPMQRMCFYGECACVRSKFCT
ncbi:Nodule Cysteine-Rich (NCR) secreted peptide [Medicago truncatula]|uniref:Nodule Cysteine-Rich (NCR) secreted peptide n=1 Tax=Medicago truncatula TaxID=3880 RepID=A7KHD5_MEDTR|nr:nodule-specific cysteine-rich peptide 290 [Medicago truncatula]AES98519.1 Nodule Cysteine-Rich (NCR) secreted peptide [Medicago truncatula]